MNSKPGLYLTMTVWEFISWIASAALLAFFGGAGVILALLSRLLTGVAS